jgi:hypothetical protein
MNERACDVIELVLYTGVDAVVAMRDVHWEFDAARYSKMQRIGLTAAELAVGALSAAARKVDYYIDARALIEPFKLMKRVQHNGA